MYIIDSLKDIVMKMKMDVVMLLEQLTWELMCCIYLVS